MRTTLNLDDDILIAVKERARREGRTVGEILSLLARRALVNEGRTTPAGEVDSFHGFEPLPRRGPAVSNDLIDRLREEDSE